MHDNEKRMVGDYEVIQAFQFGDREVVLGENLNAPPGELFLCAYAQRNDLFVQYFDAVVSDSYVEIAKLYVDRVVQQTDKTIAEMQYPHLEGVDRSIIAKEDCEPVYYENDLRDKIVVIKPEVLRREYRQGPYQLRLCTGGFGASSKSRGNACFCRDLLTGKTSRFERLDIAGIMPMDKLPTWAKKGLEICKQRQAAERSEAR
jgi:hypothetical protein